MVQNTDIDGLKLALERVRESQDAAEQAFSAFAGRDLPRENAALKAKIESISADLRQSLHKCEALQQEYEALRGNFEREMAMKRSAMIEMSEKRAREYYRAGLEREYAQINSLNADMCNRLAYMAGELRVLGETERANLQTELNDLYIRIEEQTQAARKRAAEAWADAAAKHGGALENMKSAPLDGSALSAVRKFYDWEAFLGLKIISAAGMLLIVIGVFTFGRYMYGRMTAGFQCAAIFALGLLLLTAGEILHRKWRGTFSIALTAGGAGVLFLGAALGHMTLGVLPMIPALLICAGASVLTFLLSLRYNAQLVAIFALVGGYLPLLALERDIALYAAIYFMIFDLFALAVATRKMWRVTRFFGLFAGLLSELILLNLCRGNVQLYTLGAAVGVGYIAYLIIPVFGAALTKNTIKRSDVTLLTFNAAARFLIALAWAQTVSFSSGRAWLIPSFFFVTCAAMAVLCERGRSAIMLNDEKGSLRALFFITSVTFAVLVVLFFKYDYAWFSTGWLIEAAGLLTYGFWKNRRRFVIAGITVGAVCVFAFLVFSVPRYYDPLFIAQYGLLTLGFASAALASLRAKMKRRGAAVLADVFRCAAAINVWWFIIYVLREPVFDWLRQKAEIRFVESVTVLLAIAAGLLLGLILPRVRKIYNYGFQAAAIVTSVCSAGWLVIYNAGSKSLYGFAGDPAFGAVVFGLYIVVNAVGIVWMNDLLRFVCRVKKLPVAWYPLFVSGWGLFLIAQNMVVQMNLSASSLVLTLLFGMAALAWVLFGFWKRNLQTRVSGLAMSFICVVKLFLLDLYDLTSERRIASYFTGGALLLAISFAYQYFNKKLKEEREGA